MACSSGAICRSSSWRGSAAEDGIGFRHCVSLGNQVDLEVCDFVVDGALPADQGLNSLLRLHSTEIVQLEIDSPAVVADLDTPEDYAKILSLFPKRKSRKRA